MPFAVSAAGVQKAAKTRLLHPEQSQHFSSPSQKLEAGFASRDAPDAMNFAMGAVGTISTRSIVRNTHRPAPRDVFNPAEGVTELRVSAFITRSRHCCRRQDVSTGQGEAAMNAHVSTARVLRDDSRAG